jgi:hypothetical protein
MSDWRPMRSAPHDGRAFLASDADGRMGVCYLSIDGTLCFEVGEHIIDDEFQPTHWTELPAPPA